MFRRTDWTPSRSMPHSRPQHRLPADPALYLYLNADRHGKFSFTRLDIKTFTRVRISRPCQSHVRHVEWTSSVSIFQPASLRKPLALDVPCAERIMEKSLGPMSMYSSIAWIMLDQPRQQPIVISDEFSSQWTATPWFRCITKVSDRGLGVGYMLLECILTAKPRHHVALSYHMALAILRIQELVLARRIWRQSRPTGALNGKGSQYLRWSVCPPWLI